MSKAIGTVLRALSALWIAFALVRMIAGITGFTRASDFYLGLISLLFAVGTFRFGTWLKVRKPGPPVTDRFKSAKGAWWRTNYGFRLSIFLGVIWAIGSYAWQDKPYIDFSVVFLPPFALLMLYFVYLKFVLGASKTDARQPIPVQPETNTDQNNTLVETEIRRSQPASSVSELTSKDRERAMNELISKMK